MSTEPFQYGCYDALPERLELLCQQVDHKIEETIASLQQDGPECEHPLMNRIYRWMRHYLDSGGRRMHGMTVALAYRACGGESEDSAMEIAAAMQIYHHHTLVHDDIYDEDRSRRGWPSTHEAFAGLFDPASSANSRLFVSGALRHGTITAFAYGKICRALASHMILTSTFPAEARLAVAKALDWHDLYDNAAQLKDVDFEGTAMPNPQTCLQNAWLKTGRLFEVCAFAGARLAWASDSQRRAVEAWAGQSSLAYQLKDDLEDLEADSEKGRGRGVATDLLYCKPTYLYAKAREMASKHDRETLDCWQSGERTGIEESDIIAILYHSGAVEACHIEIRRCIDRATDALQKAEPTLRVETVDEMHEYSEYFVSPGYWRRPIAIDERRAFALLV